MTRFFSRIFSSCSKNKREMKQQMVEEMNQLLPLIIDGNGAVIPATEMGCHVWSQEGWTFRRLKKIADYLNKEPEFNGLKVNIVTAISKEGDDLTQKDSGLFFTCTKDILYERLEHIFQESLSIATMTR